MSEPPDTFTGPAARLAGQCALLLGWKPDEFWAATPAEVAMILSATRAPEAESAVDRDTMNRMMENDDGVRR